MPAVKGSKQEKMIVVPHRPWRRTIIQLIVAIGFAVVGFASYQLGHFDGLRNQQEALIERDQLLEDAATYEQEIIDLRQSLVNSEQASAIDRAALVDVQVTISSLREKTQQLEGDVLFYKQVMSPELAERGLAIGQLDFYSTDEENRFQYNLVLRQEGDNENSILGYANVNLIGYEGKEEVSIPLRELSLTETQLNIRLRFRYFQNIEGELRLPDDFIPEKVQIIAVSEGNGGKTVQRDFGWLVQSR